MYKKINENEFVEMYFDEELKLFKWIWLPSTVNIDSLRTKETVTEIMASLKRMRPAYVMSDSTKKMGVFSVEDQAWIGKTTSQTFMECGLSKMAIIEPEDLLNELSVEQTVDETKKELKGGMEIRMFKDEESAKEWLLG